MTRNENGPQVVETPRGRNDQQADGSRSMTTSLPQATDNAQQAGALYAERMRQQARHEIVLGSIKAHLCEQPSSRTVRACARRWASDVIRLADEVISARQKGER